MGHLQCLLQMIERVVVAHQANRIAGPDFYRFVQNLFLWLKSELVKPGFGHAALAFVNAF